MTQPAFKFNSAASHTTHLSEQENAPSAHRQPLVNQPAKLRLAHTVSAAPPSPAPVWQQLEKILPWLTHLHDACANPSAELTKAAPWLLDNEFHVRRAVRQVREDMPPAFYQRLPRLSASYYQGQPRVLALARAVLAHSHMQLTLVQTVAYLTDYQHAEPLSMAELWALPSMLRLACLEELVQAVSELLPELTAPFERSQAQLNLPFEPSLRVSQALTALIAIASISWVRCFEQVSEVERILRTDPAHIYEVMDFDTQDSYRHAIENIAQRSPFTEWQVAKAAITLATQQGRVRRIGHVGYWLMDEGRAQLEREVGFQLSRRLRLQRWLRARPGYSYSLALVAFTLLAWAIPAVILHSLGASVTAWLLGMGLSLAPALIIGVTVSHGWIARLVTPRKLPKLNVELGLKAGWDTAVVMPVILRQLTEVAPLIERLEMHWLSNPDPRLHLALLSDLGDANTERLPTDNAIEAALVAGIRQLNTRYGEQQPFVLLHRRRQWNAGEGCWMGWERKRGKLEQLANLIIHQEAAAFTVQEGQVSALCQARFVVTLDADTRAQANNINRLVSVLAHPLNRVEFDKDTGRAIRGYTFIQPRIEISPDAGVKSLFSRLYSGDTALDIYSRAVSDVYQDLFGEGIFTGKGAFDVAAFQRCLHQRVPENAILSHDLFEGLHGRTGLASDIVFYEDFPEHYLAYARRAARWIRGDWQLTPWLAKKVPCPQQSSLNSRFTLLDRWKMLDNLRRSLVAPMLLLFALGAWLWLPGHALLWTALAVSAPASYLMMDVMGRILSARKPGLTRRLLHPLAEQTGRWALSVVFLAHEAAVAVQAMGAALWRMHISHRHLLEWTSAAHSADEVAHSVAGTWRKMALAPLLAFVMGILVALVNPAALWGAAPLLLLWFISPQVAWFISRAYRPAIATLNEQDRRYLRLIARRTWLYFETFAGPDNNWLPADNYQAPPLEATAHRSSPTNVGMLFLAALTAWDLGHIGRRDLLARTTAALDSLDNLESHDGHIFNWFDTRTLASLAPRYISTVDSGNLAVSLLTLSAGCREAAEGAILPVSRWQGLEDGLYLLLAALSELEKEVRLPISEQLISLIHQLAGMRTQSNLWSQALADLSAGPWHDLKLRIAHALEAHTAGSAHEVHLWLKRCDHHVMTMRRDLTALAPWGELIASAPQELSAMANLLAALPAPDTPLSEIKVQLAQARAALATLKSQYLALSMPNNASKQQDWLDNMAHALNQGEASAQQLQTQFLRCAERAEARAYGMAFAPLYDAQTHTFFIGHNLDSGQLDGHHYDLLASEARLASYFAIAKRDVPLKHWFRLGRPLTKAKDGLSLLSWNGSLFEYLMPVLLLPSEPARLLGQSERAAVAMQRQYGQKLGLPWGVSESAFAARNAQQDYQYQAFGVPALGLKHGLDEDYVVAPYASGLALCVDPQAATANLRRLEQLGLRDRYGFFEAVDFTPQRQAGEGKMKIVRSYMAHHQGMMAAAIGNALHNNIMVRRLSRDPRMRATELLLQERIPWEVFYEQANLAEQPSQANVATPDLSPIAIPTLSGWQAGEHEGPQLHIIGNGRLAAWITDGGDSALWWRGLAITHWPSAAQGGAARMYVSQGDQLWSLAHHAAQRVSELHLSAHNIEFHERRGALLSHYEIVLAAEDDVEFRRVTLCNDGEQLMVLQVTSYAQPVLASAGEYERHPAFSKLFIHSEYLDENQALIFTRRPRRLSDRPPVVLQRLITQDPAITGFGFTTDRRQFFGRHGNISQPQGARYLLQGRSGWTLDPIMALQAEVQLAPGAQLRLDFVTAIADTQEQVLKLSERYAHAVVLDWASQDAQRARALSAKQLRLNSATLAQAQAWCAQLVFARAHSLNSVFDTALPSQPHLWSLSISGDLPIVVLNIVDEQHSPLLEMMLRVHHWWKKCGLKVDLVCLQQGASSYQEPIRERVFAALRDIEGSEGSHSILGESGGVHLLASEQLNSYERQTLLAVARLTLDAGAENLESAVRFVAPHTLPLPAFQPLSLQQEPDLAHIPVPLVRPPLLFDNGLGGFMAESGDYLIHLAAGQTTPVPWSNVLANEHFGTLVTEAGLGFTWGINSGEHRLTPWSNDQVLDASAEAVYLRDEETGDIWTPTPLPAGGTAPCQIQHQAGATTWRRNSEGLIQSLTVVVPKVASVKLALLSLTNPSARARRLTVTYYAQWQLGAMLSTSAPYVVSGFDAEYQVLLARNDWQPEFAGRTAFLGASRTPHSLTCDRRRFLGRHSDAARPAGLMAWTLDGTLEGVSDSCGAFQVHIDLAANSTEEVVFVLGEGKDMAEAGQLARHWATVERAKQALADNHALWQTRLGSVQVTTPDAAFDLMVNRWLINQSLASRILARAGFQQASGAFGFRDQLQDMLALLMSEPQRVRAHLLTCAAHQFEQGDVLHWWHPPTGRGIKTRCSDDMLWLVYATARYVAATDDIEVLAEQVPFLTAPALGSEEVDRYGVFAQGASASLFEHCRRALEYGMTQGEHGLPLMAGGDWNDGMDRVGDKGRGESVWLAWFVADCAERFAQVTLALNNHETKLISAANLDLVSLAKRWQEQAHQLRLNVEAHAWDGQWYVRAFDDEGRAWGSKEAQECQIDSISQSWAALAGGLSPARTAQALHAADEQLMDSEANLVRLLSPVFEHTLRDPGYIRAYPPGVRENGSQYSHAAAWLGLAHTRLGQGDKAYQVFNMLNPIYHSDNINKAHHYRGEPYVVAADIRGSGKETGQAGWTWYTGAAAWSWQLAVEGILGISLQSGKVHIAPCLPRHWGGAELRIQGEQGVLVISIEDPLHLGAGRVSLSQDEQALAGQTVALPSDGSERRIIARLWPHDSSSATEHAQASDRPESV